MEILQPDESKPGETPVQPQTHATEHERNQRPITTLAARSPSQYAKKMRRRKAHRAKLKRAHTKG
jgi:hypothetical protein